VAFPAEVIVTFNIRDFPERALKPYDVMAIHPDDFLLDQLDLYPVSPLISLNSRRLPTGANPLPSTVCSRCSNARDYPGSPPKSVGISGSAASCDACAR
jgi:hypothetical protein